MNTDLISYYKERAKEYENIYLKPERQNDLQLATTILQQIFTHKNIVEICCGTGYWTEKIATTATSIFATDINDTVIDIAKHKSYVYNNVIFGIADFYSFEPPRQYEGLFGGFIWSHIQLQDLHKFIAKASRCVAPGSTIVFMDNKFVAGSSLPVTETDAEGNTFQTRSLADGSTHLVRKNFPAKDFVLHKIKEFASTVEFTELDYYWIVSYKTQGKVL
ncbi:class I SAM-dependent methyltransferase [Ferruginibacter profundus]